ncbi:MAG: arsenosugar biosynthesis radical SAM (seleno)protein ArsS [Pseudomonadota bacterium]|nr:arsenosugar biosynthesis radical SAM (seleno)protein ArsS [Pseudomonadota bacterium]
MHEIYPLIVKTDFPNIYREKLETLQINLGYKCNQACLHCHVDAGPKRKEMMGFDTINEILNFIKKSRIGTIDLTGGAPELNPHFKFLVNEAKKLGCHVIDRCNLTVLIELRNEDMINFFVNNSVEIVASLPCYEKKNVDTQRGKGVFEKSIDVLRKLNENGYGFLKNLKLNLVYNPQGPELPPNQSDLEVLYKNKLESEYGIKFNNLFVITNMPIARFGNTLISKNCFQEYMSLLKESFSAKALDHVMCKKLISVDYQGHIYDCDFNQMLKIGVFGNKKKHISDINIEQLVGSKVNVADHCYGCTAGEGSSCGGSLT